MSWRRFATLAGEQLVRAASLIWPRSSSAPPTSVTSRLAISNA